jgi:hypothetical protein
MGSGTSETLRAVSKELAIEFAREAEDDREVKVEVIYVESGKEPREFTRHFHAWATRKREDVRICLFYSI